MCTWAYPRPIAACGSGLHALAERNSLSVSRGSSCWSYQRPPSFGDSPGSPPIDGGQSTSKPLPDHQQLVMLCTGVLGGCRSCPDQMRTGWVVRKFSRKAFSLLSWSHGCRGGRTGCPRDLSWCSSPGAWSHMCMDLLGSWLLYPFPLPTKV